MLFNPALVLELSDSILIYVFDNNKAMKQWKKDFKDIISNKSYYDALFNPEDGITLKHDGHCIHHCPCARLNSSNKEVDIRRVTRKK